MTQLPEYQQNALAFRLIDTITQASSSEVVAVLKANGFEGEFPYGDNPQQAVIILQQLSVADRPRFLRLLRNMKIDFSKVAPNQKEGYQSLIRATNPNARLDDWFGGVLDMLSPKTTTGGEQTITEKTTSGAYVAYVVIVIAIIGITVYMFKTLK